MAAAPIASTTTASPIQPHPRRRDWWTIPAPWVAALHGAPSFESISRDRVAVHRCSLPILARTYPSEVAPLLVVPTADELARARLDAETEALGFRLRHHQHTGREFILPRRGVLLADQMRTGKTLSALMCHDPASGPLLVVAPLATRSVWLGWMKKRWPEIEPLVLRGRRDDPTMLTDKPLVFVNYDIVSGWQNFGLRRIGTLILDEAHIISQKRTRRTQACLLLSSRSERVIAATGTPLWNKPPGLWSVLACINPGAWGKWFAFAQAYGNPKMGPHGFIYEGTSREDEFKARMAEVMIRREWRDLRDDIPDVERTVEIADVTEAQMAKLDALAETIRDHARKRVPAGEAARYRRLLGQLKADLAIDAATRVLDGNEPVVVWTWHRDVAHKIAKAIGQRGYISYCVTGGSESDVLDVAMAEWKRYPVAALVITISVGQVGIDLSHARHAIFAEVDWTPSTVAQAEMRTFSPDRPMAITYLVVDHSIDRALIDGLQRKCDAASALGVPAADSAIDVIAGAFGYRPEKADMQRLMDAFLAVD